MSYSQEYLVENRIWVRFDNIGSQHTYMVNNVPKCLAMAKQTPGRCQNNAGVGTDHSGTGRCKFHGGRSGRPPETGRYAKAAKAKLSEAFQEFMNDPNAKDLTAELALQRSILEQIVKKYEDADTNTDLEYSLLKQQAAMIPAIVQTVKSIESIENSKVLTVASARLMMAKAVDTMRNLLYLWFDDKDLAEVRLGQFIDQWQTQVEKPLLGDGNE